MAKTNPNNQYLDVLACPECGSYGPFYIDTLSVALVADQRIISVSGQDEWVYDSNCRCAGCDFDGTVKEFSR